MRYHSHFLFVWKAYWFHFVWKKFIKSFKCRSRLLWVERRILSFPWLQRLACIILSLRIDVHTYIIGHYNPSVRIIVLVSHTTYVVCVSFIHKCWDLQFKVDSELQIFWEAFHGNLFTLRVFARNLQICLDPSWNNGFSSNKPTHYLLDHCEFDVVCG